MTTKSKNAGAGGAAKPARRAQTHPSRQGPASRRVPLSTIISASVTSLIVLAIFAHAVMSNASSAGSGPPMVNAADLNPSSSLLATGTRAPNFTLKDVNGQTHSLAAQRGHPVLLEFFAVWCPVCQGEAPIMAQLTKNYTPRGVTVWSVLANPYGRNYEDSGGTDLRLANKGDLGWFASTFNVRHPQLIDPTFHTVNTYGANAYPTLYVVNGQGKIVYAASGHESYHTLAKHLTAALQGT